MRLLDLCCGAGGAAKGYRAAGFTEIVGVDVAPQPRYPFDFIRADAMSVGLDGFDAYHVSPPCQRYTNAQRIRGREHPDMIAPIRARLIATGCPYVIENVPGAPLLSPIELCGQMFGLDLYRHRLFEASFALNAPRHPAHIKPQAKMGRPVADDRVIQVVGNFSGVARARAAMGIEWMSRDELSEAIPPAYTEYIGRQLLAHLRAGACALLP